MRAILFASATAALLWPRACSSTLVAAVRSPSFELRSAEKRRGLHPGEHASALFRELDGTAAVGERAGQITPQAQHLAEDCVRSVEGLERALALLDEECFQGGLSLGRAPEVCARQRPPHAAQARYGGAGA
jgi:hypothetical protein